jgi:hypothetical protein
MDMMKDKSKFFISFGLSVFLPLLIALLLKIPKDITLSYNRIFYLLFCGPLGIFDLLAGFYAPLLIRMVIIICRLCIQLPFLKIQKNFLFWNILFAIVWTISGFIVGAFLYQTA